MVEWVEKLKMNLQCNQCQEESSPEDEAAV